MEEANRLGSGSPEKLLLYVITNSRVGRVGWLRRLWSNDMNIISNIVKMHQAADSDRKAVVLALVSTQYSLHELRELGFRASSTQYARSRQLAGANSYALTRYARAVPPSRRPVGQQQRQLVIQYLNKYSRTSSETLADGRHVSIYNDATCLFIQSHKLIMLAMHRYDILK